MSEPQWRRVPATSIERARAARAARLPIGAFVVVCVLVGALGATVSLTLAHVYPPATPVGWVLAALCCVWLGVLLTWGDRATRASARQDAERGEVDELHVVASAAVVAPDSKLRRRSRVMAVFLQIGPEHVLAVVMSRNQLWTEFGLDVDQMRAATDKDVPNELGPPHSFPAREFTIRRLPNLRVVTSIQVEGEYLTPGEVLVDLDRLALWGAEVVPGHLDRLPEALAGLR